MLAASVLQASTSKLVSFDPNLNFPEKGEQCVLNFDAVDPKITFDQVIASWNVQSAPTASLLVEVRAHGAGYDTKWYTMGRWSLDGRAAPRASLNGQKDADGNVDTDTLTLK